jgi:hypothetical protein
VQPIDRGRPRRARTGSRPRGRWPSPRWNCRSAARGSPTPARMIWCPAPADGEAEDLDGHDRARQVDDSPDGILDAACCLTSAGLTTQPRWAVPRGAHINACDCSRDARQHAQSRRSGCDARRAGSSDLGQPSRMNIPSRVFPYTATNARHSAVRLLGSPVGPRGRVRWATRPLPGVVILRIIAISRSIEAGLVPADHRRLAVKVGDARLLRWRWRRSEPGRARWRAAARWVLAGGIGLPCSGSAAGCSVRCSTKSTMSVRMGPSSGSVCTDARCPVQITGPDGLPRAGPQPSDDLPRGPGYSLPVGLGACRCRSSKAVT